MSKASPKNILIDERLYVFFLKIGIRQECPLLILTFKSIIK